MTLDEVRAIRNARPFRAFTLVTTTGERLDVPHPDFLIVPPDRPGVTREDYLIHYPPTASGFQWVSIDHVVSVQFGMEAKETQA